ncbi:MAG: hypothetical protein CMJ29_10955 [Phycisphaerae bacterium]|nr:hypothetical protein [Phycisphaerae bacterium]
MSLTTKVGVLTGATTIMLAGTAFAATPSADMNMQARLEAAEAKIAELSSQQDADWLTEQRAEEIREIVQDVLADADTRASLQGSNMSAGYDDGFVISSSDGKWMLRINGLLQNRWVLSRNETRNTPLQGAAFADALNNFFAGQPNAISPSPNWPNNPGASTIYPNIAPFNVPVLSYNGAITGSGTNYDGTVVPPAGGVVPSIPGAVPYGTVAGVNANLPGAVGGYYVLPNGQVAYSEPGAMSEGFGFPFNYGNHTNNGFETTRAAINLSGVIAEDYYYNMRLNWSPYNTSTQNISTQLAGAFASPTGVAAATPSPGISDGVLEWAYGGIKLNDEFSVQIGRQKYDVMRGFMVNAEYQQTIERSLYTYFWATTNLTNGIKVKWDTDMFRVNAMYSNASSNFAVAEQSAYWTNAAEYAFSGRAEVLFAGTWDQFNQISSPAGEEMGIMAGVGAAYLDSDDSLFPYSGRSNWQVTGDLSVQGGGWNFMYSISVGDSRESASNNPWGMEISGGAYLTDDIELYGRYQWLDPAYSQIYGSNDDLNIMSFGVNYYMAGNNAKLSLDWSWSFSQVVALGSGYGYTNWLPSGDNGGEWLLRTQLQLFF